MDEFVMLVSKDSEETPGDGDASGKITLGAGQGVGSCGTLEEEQGEEDEDLCPHARGVNCSIYAESGECREYNEDSGPTVVERKRKMNEKLVGDRLGRVIFFDDIVNVSYTGADKEGEDESPNVMLMSPEVDVNRVENDENRETPRNAIDDNPFSVGTELINDGTEEKKVDQRPDEECPRCWGDVSLLSGVVQTVRRGDCVNVGAQEKEVGALSRKVRPQTRSVCYSFAPARFAPAVALSTLQTRCPVPNSAFSMKSWGTSGAEALPKARLNWS
jgi:hypothetical protein